MAGEARVQSSLQVRKVAASGEVLIDYVGRPSAFLASVDGTKGPTPGAVAVSDVATPISLAALQTPGLCRLMNQDSTNRISVNVTLELLPGESYVIRLNQDYGTLGTGTPSNVTDFTAETDPGVTANLLVEAFER